jgi:hypothetical protein
MPSPMSFKPNFKPAKGTALIERRTNRKDIVASEEREKAKVRRRDVKCIWPNCENCRSFKPRLEVAHGKAKGMGGDHGERSTADNMSLLDYLTHQGERSIHSGHKRIRPLTKFGHNGPRACEERETLSSPWLLKGIVGQ